MLSLPLNLKVLSPFVLSFHDLQSCQNFFFNFPNPPGKSLPTLSATPTLNTCKYKIQHGLVEYTAPSAGWRMEHIPS